MKKKWLRISAAVLAIAALVAPVTTAAAATANKVDRAFVGEMPLHHAMAIEMARMALEQGEHAEIKSTSRTIIKSQKSEIVRLRKIGKRLGVPPTHPHDHPQIMDDLETLGLNMKTAGMAMGMEELDGADPFDRQFIDMMITHHRGAILMARAELRRGKYPSLRKIARLIVAAQAEEIREMNAWRTAWYGAPSPSGGVPKG